MTTYEVHFDGRIQESFDSPDDAIEWAQEVAETKRVVDVAIKPRFLPPRFLTAFPESERASREAAWSIPLFATLFSSGGWGGGAGAGGGC